MSLRKMEISYPLPPPPFQSDQWFIGNRKMAVFQTPSPLRRVTSVLIFFRFDIRLYSKEHTGPETVENGIGGELPGPKPWLW